MISISLSIYTYTGLCNIYYSEKGHYTDKSLHNLVWCIFSHSSDTNQGIYPRAAFMTVFAVYSEAIIQEWLL